MPGRVYTPQELADAMRRAGFPANAIQTGLAVAMAESNLRSDAINDTRGVDPAVLAARGHSAEYSVGPWQLNLQAHPNIKPEDAMDLDKATAHAYQLWLTRGWQPWGAFTDKRYLQFYQPAGGGGANVGDDKISKRLRKPPATIVDSNGNKQFDIKPSSGGFIVRYEDGDYDFISNTDLFGNTIPPDEAERIRLGRDQLNLAIQKYQSDLGNDAAQRDLSNRQLAEQQRQFNERMGMEKSMFDQRQAVDEGGLTGYFTKNGKTSPTLPREGFWEGQRQFDTNTIARNADRDVTRGQTLLGLGSRPETIFRYLYGRQGLQTPEGIFDKLAPLPGFGPDAAAGATDSRQNPQPLPRAGSQPAAPADTAATPPPPGGSSTPPPPPPPAEPVFTRNGVTSGASVNLTTNNGITTPEPTLAATGVPGANTGQTVPFAQFGGQEPAWLRAALSGKSVNRYAAGGRIPEPVLGRGLISGQEYSFGEEGPEYVVPNDELDNGEPPSGDGDLWEKVGRLLKGLLDDKGTKQVRDARRKGSVGELLKKRNSYAGGGLIGFEHRGSDRDLYQPGGLDYMANASTLPGGVPNIPQLQQFSGGTSLLPSAQRITNSTPTERAAFGGMVNDVFGIPQEDIWDLAQKLAPQVGRVRTPRYSS